MLHKRFAGEKCSSEKRVFEKRARLRGMLVAALACVLMVACAALTCPFAVAETADASAAQPDSTARMSGSTGHVSVSTADQAMVRVEGFGVSFELPAGTCAAPIPSVASTAAREVACWRVPCGAALLDGAHAGPGAPADDSSSFALVAFSCSLLGEQFSLQAYTDGLIAQAAASSDAARVAEGGFGTSAAGVGYYLTGMVDRTLMTVVVALPVDGPEGEPLVTVLALRGLASDDAVVRGIYALLESLEPATGENPAATAVFDRPTGLAYYSVSRLVMLPSDMVADLLECDAADLSYVDRAPLQGWAGADGGPLGADACLVALVEYDDPDADGPFATRASALEGGRLGGVQVEWYGAAIPWDEAADAANLLMEACGLTGTLDDGYTRPWDDAGAYAWARVGSCLIGDEPGYWLILVDATRGDDACTVTISADLLNGTAITTGFSSYNELVDTLLGW